MVAINLAAEVLFLIRYKIFFGSHYRNLGGNKVLCMSRDYHICLCFECSVILISSFLVKYYLIRERFFSISATKIQKIIEICKSRAKIFA